MSLLNFWRFLSAAIAAALTLTGASATGGQAPNMPACASVVIAERTATGHEADLPVTVCGGIGRTGSFVCAAGAGGLRANARLQCTRSRP